MRGLYLPPATRLAGPLPPALLVKKPVTGPVEAVYYRVNKTKSGYITNASVLQEASSKKCGEGEIRTLEPDYLRLLT